MASPSLRFEKNAEGRYYVDDSCIYCDLCRELAPTLFAKDRAAGIAYVFKQPESDEEHALAAEIIDACYTQSIGDLENPDINHSLKKWWQIWK